MRHISWSNGVTPHMDFSERLNAELRHPGGERLR
jgi:hypothetical protein